MNIRGTRVWKSLDRVCDVVFPWPKSDEELVDLLRKRCARSDHWQIIALVVLVLLVLIILTLFKIVEVINRLESSDVIIGLNFDPVLVACGVLPLVASIIISAYLCPRALQFSDMIIGSVDFFRRRTLTKELWQKHRKQCTPDERDVVAILRRPIRTWIGTFKALLASLGLIMLPMSPLSSLIIILILVKTIPDFASSLTLLDRDLTHIFICSEAVFIGLLWGFLGSFILHLPPKSKAQRREKKLFLKLWDLEHPNETIYSTPAGPLYE